MITIKQERIAQELKHFLPYFAVHKYAKRAGGERDFIATYVLDFADLQKVHAVLGAILLAVRSYRGNL